MWKNPQGLECTTFPLTTVNLSILDFDLYEILYLYDKINDGNAIMMSQRSVKGCSTQLRLINPNKSSDSNIAVRNVTWNDNKLVFQHVTYQGSVIDNDHYLIPIYIIGYKLPI